MNAAKVLAVLAMFSLMACAGPGARTADGSDPHPHAGGGATPSAAAHGSSDTHPQAGGSVAPPTPDQVTVRITAAQAGQIVDVGIGQRFVVQLVGVPTAGYVWAPRTTPDFLAAGSVTSGPTTAAQAQPGFVGGNHWEVFLFTALRAGEGELVFEQRRPWETNEPANASFRVTIRAR